MRHRFIALALIAACRSNDNGAQPSASPPRPPADRTAALQTCTAAFAELARGTELADGAALYARGCKDLYRAPGCHDVIGRLAEIEPEERLVTVATACAKAYCPTLADPPKLCASDPAGFGLELAAEWKQLDARILGRELGVDPHSPPIQSIAGVMFQEITAVRSPNRSAPVAKPQLRVSVSTTENHVTIRLDGHVALGLDQVSTAPTATELAPLVAALQQAPDHADVDVVIEVSSTTPHAVVTAILNAVKSAGITHMALAATAR